MATIQLLVVAAVVLLEAKREDYDGYKLYLITPKTVDQAEILHQLHSVPNFDILQESKVLGSQVRVMASPEVQGRFEEALEKFTEEGLQYQLLIENVQKLLDDEYSSFVNRSLSLNAGTRALRDDYHPHDRVL
ncbi:carboxypeptidase B1-like [Euwallacea fornicatus]|uniref:carboxypeptidase B1-like n=1 Tax=Euwallacea fornicatus TaxID=995702 RepID=UPI00338D9B67